MKLLYLFLTTLMVNLLKADKSAVKSAVKTPIPINRDGHHHHHHVQHPAAHSPINFQNYASHPYPRDPNEAHDEDESPGEVESESQISYHVEEQPQSTYHHQVPSHYASPSHTGYYYYYYPVKASKPKFKIPGLSKMSNLKLPDYIGKEGSDAGSSMKNVGTAAFTSLLVAGSLFFALPMLGLGSGKRSLSSVQLNTDYVNQLGQYVEKIIDRYDEKNI